MGKGEGEDEEGKRRVSSIMARVKGPSAKLSLLIIVQTPVNEMGEKDRNGSELKILHAYLCLMYIMMSVCVGV